MEPSGVGGDAVCRRDSCRCWVEVQLRVVGGGAAVLAGRWWSGRD